MLEPSVPYTSRPYWSDAIWDEKGVKNLVTDSRDKPLLLMVGGEFKMRRTMINHLSKDFNFFSLNKWEEEFQMVSKMNPRIILLDLETCGYELGDSLRKNGSTSHIPFVFLTERNFSYQETKAFEVGAIDCIPNTVKPDLLRLKLLNWIKHTEQLSVKNLSEKVFNLKEITLNSRDEEFLKKAVKEVNAHMGDSDLDVEKLSSFLLLSPNQVYRKIKFLSCSFH